MTERRETTLLRAKYVDDTVAAEDAGKSPVRTSGLSVRIVARTEFDGRTSSAITVSEREHRMRASGRAYSRWRALSVVSIARTKQGLVVMRNGRSTFSTRGFTSGHLFAGDSIDALAKRSGLSLILRQVGGRAARTLRTVEGVEPENLEEAIEVALDSVRAHIGVLPNWDERFPLLAGTDDGARCSRVDGASAYMPYLDAPDVAQVARNLFGKRSYRKPLAREVARLGPDAIRWFVLFRGLVPVDWIIDAMGRHTGSLGWVGPRDGRLIRQVLRRTPQPVLRRILAEPPWSARQTLADTADLLENRRTVLRDINLIPEVIAARGQRHVRNSRDLEQIVREMPRINRPKDRRSHAAAVVAARETEALQTMEIYNGQARLLPDGVAPTATWERWQDARFREQAEALVEARRREVMAARERERIEQEETYRQRRLQEQAERHEWAVRTTGQIDGARIGRAHRLVVARDAETLARWGAAMHNCIGSYARALDLDVFAAILDEIDEVRLNIQINAERGITQILGKHNRDAVDELGPVAPDVLDALAKFGIELDQHALGGHGLRPTQTTAA